MRRDIRDRNNLVMQHNLAFLPLPAAESVINDWIEGIKSSNVMYFNLYITIYSEESSKESLELINSNIADIVKETKKKIEGLTIINGQINNECAIALKESESIKTLDLSNSKVSVEAINELAQSNSINTLNLSNQQNIDPTCVQKLKDNKSIKTLILKNTNIDNAGVIELTKNNTITTLNLENCKNIKNVRAEIKKDNPEIKVEDGEIIKENNPVTMRNCTEALVNNKTIQTLRIAGTGISKSDAFQIAQSKRNVSIENENLNATILKEKQNNAKVLTAIREVNTYLSKREEETSLSFWKRLTGTFSGRDYDKRKESWEKILKTFEDLGKKTRITNSDIAILKELIETESKKFAPIQFLNFKSRSDYHNALNALHKAIPEQFVMSDEFKESIKRFTAMHTSMRNLRDAAQPLFVYSLFSASKQHLEQYAPDVNTATKKYSDNFSSLTEVEKSGFLAPKKEIDAQYKNIMRRFGN